MNVLYSYMHKSYNEWYASAYLFCICISINMGNFKLKCCYICVCFTHSPRTLWCINIDIFAWETRGNWAWKVNFFCLLFYTFSRWDKFIFTWLLSTAPTTTTTCVYLWAWLGLTGKRFAMPASLYAKMIIISVRNWIVNMWKMIELK